MSSPGWDERPSLSFRSSESLSQVSESSPLATIRTYLRSLLEVMNIAFGRPIRASISHPESLSYELLIWVIPPALDPIYYHAHACQFEELGAYLERCESFRINRLEQRDLAGSYRGWVKDETPAVTEPSEKPHVFFFLWRGTEAETRCKDGMEEGRMQEPWNDNFIAVHQQWERRGCEAKAYI